MLERLVNRVRAGLIRSAASFGQATRMALCAVFAYAFAEKLLGHVHPVFTVTSSLIALQFSGDRRVRRVLEIAIGCTLGVAAGEVLTHLLGRGTVQSLITVLFAVALARFLDNGAVFATQLALQAVLVAMMPLAPSGVFSTSIDAAVGGFFALLVTVLIPEGRLKRPQGALRSLTRELSLVLRQCSAALESHDSSLAMHALERGRKSQVFVEQTMQAVVRAEETSLISPFHWRHRADVQFFRNSAEKLDLALRNSRVFSRRLTYAINNVALPAAEAKELSSTLSCASEIVRKIGDDFAQSQAVVRTTRLLSTTRTLSRLANTLDPKTCKASTMEGQALILILRPLVVDLLEATGVPHDEAAATLPRLPNSLSSETQTPTGL